MVSISKFLASTSAALVGLCLAHVLDPGELSIDLPAEIIFLLSVATAGSFGDASLVCVGVFAYSGAKKLVSFFRFLPVLCLMPRPELDSSGTQAVGLLEFCCCQSVGFSSCF